MPTYEYRCRDCGQNLEVVQAFSDEPLTECPHCQGALRKVFNPVGISFKGSGFYKNDSRSTSSSPSSSPSSDSKASSRDSTSSSADTSAPPDRSGSADGGGSGASASSTTTEAAPA
jgi:putative FmdB family regulatory protein